MPTKQELIVENSNLRRQVDSLENKIRQMDMDEKERILDAKLEEAEAAANGREFLRKMKAKGVDVNNPRGNTSRKKTASKHERVQTEFERLTKVEGLKEKAAIKKLQAWIDTENINSGGYDEPYLKGTILGLK